jgi:hypothetical protein
VFLRDSGQGLLQRGAERIARLYVEKRGKIVRIEKVIAVEKRDGQSQLGQAAIRYILSFETTPQKGLIVGPGPA